MVKKIASLISAVLLAMPLFQIPAHAEEQLPFTLTAPEHVAITYLNGDDSPSTCQIAWSKNASMSEWAAKHADPETHDATVKALGDMGYDDLWFSAQMDWSIDSTEDWHYNSYWDTEGYDENYIQHLGEWAYTSFLDSPEITTTAWVFRYMGNIEDEGDYAWFGRHADSDDFNGWKDVLKEGQYTIIDDDGSKQAKLNFDEHTVNVRMRWLVTGRKLDGSEIHVGSDWSEIASVGKDAKPVAEAFKQGDIPAPAIRDLRYADEDFNTFPVVAFYLDVPDTVSQALTKAAAVNGEIRMITEARIPNGKWIELQGDFKLKSGEMKIALQSLAEDTKSIPKDTPIELRCYYDCDPGNGVWFQTDYSNVLTFGAAAMQAATDTAPAESTVSAAQTTSASHTENTLKKTLNWLWILLIVLAVIVLLVIIYLVMRNKKNDQKQK